MTETGSELQFDRAQFEAAPATACAFCARPLAGSYYEINGRLACESCRERVEQVWTGGSGIARFAKACVFGIAAGAVGCGIYYAVRALTGYELSLISIAVGWLVGMGVRKGSSGRGGWPYQLLAVFITYTAIVGSYAPLILQGLREGTRKDSPATAGQPPEDASKKESSEKPTGVKLVVGFAVLAAVVYISPFLMVFASGGQGLIGLLIIGFGMWQAWKLNAKARLAIAGPFNLAKPPLPPSPAPSDVA